MPALAGKDERPASYGQKIVSQAEALTVFSGLDTRRWQLEFQAKLHRQLGLLPKWRVQHFGDKNGDENGATVISNGGFEKEERERETF